MTTDATAQNQGESCKAPRRPDKPAALSENRGYGSVARRPFTLPHRHASLFVDMQTAPVTPPRRPAKTMSTLATSTQ